MSSLKEKKRKVLQTRKNTTKRRKETSEVIAPSEQLPTGPRVSLDDVVKIDSKTAKVTFEVPKEDPTVAHETETITVEDAAQRRKHVIEFLSNLRAEEKSQRRKSRVFIFVDGETYRPRNMRALIHELGLGLLDMSLKKVKPDDKNRLQPLPGKILRRQNKHSEYLKKKSRERARLAVGSSQGGSGQSCGFGAFLHERQPNLEQDIAIDACKAGKANTAIITDEACKFVFAKFRSKVDVVVSFNTAATRSMYNTRDRLVKPGGKHVMYVIDGEKNELRDDTNDAIEPKTNDEFEKKEKETSHEIEPKTETSDKK